MYVPKKEPEEITAFGVLQKNFNQGYAKVIISKCFEKVILPKYLEVDPNYAFL